MTISSSWSLGTIMNTDILTVLLTCWFMLQRNLNKPFFLQTKYKVERNLDINKRKQTCLLLSFFLLKFDCLFCEIEFDFVSEIQNETQRKRNSMESKPRILRLGIYQGGDSDKQTNLKYDFNFIVISIFFYLFIFFIFYFLFIFGLFENQITSFIVILIIFI